MLLESLKASFIGAIAVSIAIAVGSSNIFAFDLTCCDTSVGSKIPAAAGDAEKLNSLRIKKCDSTSQFFKKAALQGKIKVINAGQCGAEWEKSYLLLTDKRYGKIDSLNGASSTVPAKKK